MSDHKELNFFVAERNWNKGIAWYRQQFQSKKPIVGEASPFYTHYPRFADVPERIHQVAPDAKLIYILRDPIERIISQFVHTTALGFETREFEEAVFDKRNSNLYLVTSQYFLQMQRYLALFDEKQLLVVTNEQLDKQRNKTLCEIFSFLDVDESFECANFELRLNQSRDKRLRNQLGKKLATTRLAKTIRSLPDRVRYRIESILFHSFTKTVERPSVSSQTRQRLMEILCPDVEALRKQTGRKFDEWSI